MKTIDEINRILKINNEKQKSKFLPNLIRDIKGLQFNPELFQFYTQNIKNKKNQQEVLYKKVKQDDRHFTKLLTKEQKRLEIKVQEMQNIQADIVECQKQIKQVREKYDRLHRQIKDHEDDMLDKINEENKILKEINDKNKFLEADFISTKKDLENVIIETKDKFKISQDKLNLAQKSIKSMTREFKRKTELLKNLNTPEMLVPIKSKTDDSLKKVRKLPTRREMTIKNLNIENNGARVNTTSANENVLTTTSGSVENKNKENNKNIVRRESKKKK